MSDRDRFNKFTERARKVLSLAQEEAQRLQHNYIGIEHLLLGLLREGEGVAAKVLMNLGLDLQEMRQAIIEQVGRGDRIILGEVKLTHHAKQAIELAADEAQRLNHLYIGTEHLLLGLIRVSESKAAQILQSRGISLEQVRTETIQILSQSGAPREVSSQRETSTSNHFNWFTNDVRRVLNHAHEEAEHFQHNYIGTEHLLLGLLHEQESVAVTVLENLGAESARIRKDVELIIRRGDVIALGQIGLTPRAKKVIELAVDESRHLNQDTIGTPHLLVGLLREGGGIAAGVLARLGVTLEKVRGETPRVLQQKQEITDKNQQESLPIDENQQETSSATDSPMPQVIVQTQSRKPFHGHPFTDQAHKVLEQAQEEALRFQHNYIGTEHLLLGLVRDGEGVGGVVLQNLGVRLSKVRSAVEFIIGRGDRIVPGEMIGLTPRANKVIEFAVDESRRLNNNYVGTEHLLLGMVGEGEGIAAGVLESMGVTLSRVRAETLRVLKHAQPEEPKEEQGDSP